MILLDKYLNLPEWVRQLSLAGFLFALAGVGYWLILRPLRKRINPLYAASRVEKTIDDAKNSVTGYVEAQEKGEIHDAVKAAMSAKAAKAVGEADVNQAVDHRSLIVAGRRPHHCSCSRSWFCSSSSDQRNSAHSWAARSSHSRPTRSRRERS